MENDILNELIVVKRSGQRVNFNGTKIALAIKNAFDSVDYNYSDADINKVYENVLKHINLTYIDRKTINVEDIQDIIENKLKLNKYELVYEAFNSYRLRRAASRKVFSIKQQHKFVKAIETLGLQTNGIFYNQPSNIMLDFGKTVSREFSKAYLLENKYVRSHEEGNIYIHDLSYYPLYTTSSSHLNFRILENDYIEDYLETIINIIRKCKREQTGEHGIPAFDLCLSKSLVNNFKIVYKKILFNYLKFSGFTEYVNIKHLNIIIDKIDTINFNNKIFDNYLLNDKIKEIFNLAYDETFKEVKEKLLKSIKNTLINLNNLDSNLNDNKVVISINSGLHFESKLITEIYIDALLLLENLENVMTIYKLDKNKSIPYEILNPIIENKNISFSFDKDVEYFSLGEKIFKNINNDMCTSIGRGILSTTSINLGRIGLLCKNKPKEEFYKILSDTLDFAKNQLIQRFELQANRLEKNFPNLFKYNLLLDSDKLDEGQKIRKVLKNFVLNIGLVGLIECSDFLKKNGCNISTIEILKYINKKIDQYTIDTKYNFILTQTESKKILKDLLIIDKAIYGANSFEKNKDSYSLINNITLDDLSGEYGKMQKLLNMPINIYLKSNSSQKKILQSIENIKTYEILYFTIRLRKNDN